MKKYILPICMITLVLVLTTLTFSSAGTNSQEFTWQVTGKATETFQNLALEFDKGQIPNNEYLSQSNGLIEFFYRSDGDLRITLEKTSGEQVILATADSRGQDNDPCNWNDNRCIVDRNGQLLFASTWEGSSSIDDKNYQQCPIINCGVGNKKCSKDDIKTAAVSQGLNNEYKCMSKPFVSKILAGEKIKTYYNNGGNIGIRIFQELEEERNAIDSGIDSVSISDEDKLVAIFSAEPKAEKSGAISNIQYELSDDNIKVLTSLVSKEVHACLDSNQDNICDYLQINNNLFIKINSPTDNNIYNTTQILVNIDSQGTSTWFSINSGNNEQYVSPITKTFQEGANSLTAYTENQFGTINSTSVSFQVNTTSQNDTNQTDNTPPGTVTLLSLIDKGKTFLTWQWQNPTDSDFSKAVLYLDGTNVGETSSNTYNATSLQPNSTHTLTINTKDTSGNINFTNISNTATTLSDDTNQTDTTPPNTITNLQLIGITNTTLKWEWNNPIDTDFDMTLIYIDNVNQINLSSTENMYESANLQPNSTHTITVLTKDTSGNINNTPISNTGTTSANPTNPTDTTPPGTITNLTATNITNSSITWTWSNPNDADFSNVIILLEGINVANTTSESYIATNLNSNTSYTITLNTVDLNGNINNTNISNTAKTLSTSVNQTNQTDSGRTPDDELDNDNEDSGSKSSGGSSGSRSSGIYIPTFIPAPVDKEISNETISLGTSGPDYLVSKSSLSLTNKILLILAIIILITLILVGIIKSR